MIFTTRLNELRQTANPPFTSASAEYGNYFLAKTKEALALDASSKIDGIDLAMKTVLEEHFCPQVILAWVVQVRAGNCSI